MRSAFAREAESAAHLPSTAATPRNAAQLIAVNNCLCVVTLRVRIEQSDFAAIPQGANYQATSSRASGSTWWRRGEPTAAEGRAAASPGRQRSARRRRYTTRRVPIARPLPSAPLLWSRRRIRTRITHVTPDSRYAVDFALPDGTAVYAARAGTVINVRHDSFRRRRTAGDARSGQRHRDSPRRRHDRRLCTPAVGFDPGADRAARPARRVHRQLRQHRLHHRAAPAFRRVAQRRRSRCVRPRRVQPASAACR